MSQPAISCGVATRPKPNRPPSPACASAVVARRIDTAPIAPPAAAQRTALAELDIPHLSIGLHVPSLDRVVVIDRPRAAHRAQRRECRLHVAGLVDRPALQEGRAAVPVPVDAEAG